MSVSAADFFQSATAMLKEGSNIGRRNAISRSYYAAYHDGLRIAEQYCPDQKAHLEMGSHQRLIERFKDSTALGKKGRTWAIMLQYLKTQRHKADYHLNDKISQSEAETHVNTVERLLNELAEFSTASDAATS